MKTSEHIEKLAEKYVDIIKQEGRVEWQNLSGYYVKGILVSMLREYDQERLAPWIGASHE